MTVYENSFDANEWFVLVQLVLLNILVWRTPKQLSPLEGIGHYLYGVSVGMMFDHTISIEPWNFYDVNDSSAYQWIDALSYVMYGPYSYFFAYLYARLKITGYANIGYIGFWALFALFMEWIGIQVGLFHYDEGYKMYWSFPIYLATLSVQVIYYHVARSHRTG